MRSSENERLRHEAVFWVAAVRLGLWVVPFGRLRRWLGRASRPGRPARGRQGRGPRGLPQASVQASAGDIGQAVRAARGFVPRTNCLVEALAAEVMLRRRGVPAELQLGVAAEGVGGDLKGHAWVICAGEVVVGGALTTYVPLGSASLNPRW